VVVFFHRGGKEQSLRATGYGYVGHIHKLAETIGEKIRKNQAGRNAARDL
jgi:hypothetical protein